MKLPPARPANGRSMGRKDGPYREDQPHHGNVRSAARPDDAADPFSGYRQFNRLRQFALFLLHLPILAGRAGAAAGAILAEALVLADQAVRDHAIVQTVQQLQAHSSGARPRGFPFAVMPYTKFDGFQR